MSGWTKDPKEAYPLQEREPRPDVALENNAEEKDDGAMSFAQNQPPPPGFIYLPLPRESADNPYSTQPPYNPSYTLVDDTIVPQTNYALERGNGLGDENNAKDDEIPAEEKDSCLTYCIVVFVIAIAICAIGGVIYLLVKNPKIARALHTIAIEARKPHDDDEETPFFKKIFSPVVTNEFVKLINGTARS